MFTIHSISSRFYSDRFEQICIGKETTLQRVELLTVFICEFDTAAWFCDTLILSTIYVSVALLLKPNGYKLDDK